jgi:hypothetical protein
MKYSVRSVDLQEAEDECVRLWRANLAMRGDPRDKFRWYYRENPLGPAQAFLLEIHGDGAHTRVVGCCGIGPRQGHHRGRTLLAGLHADFAIDRDHRTVMPALLVQRAMAAHARERFDLTMAFPNDAAVGVFSRVGFRILGRAGRYVKLLRHGPFLQRRLRSAALARLAAAAPDAVGRGVDAAKAAVLPRRLRLTWTRDADSRFDRLWETARPPRGALGDRSGAFLRWRFTERPGVPAEMAALIDADDGEIHAYAAVVSKSPGEALLADFLGRNEEALSSLLRLLIPALREREFDSVVAYFLGDPRVHALLADHGFSLRNPGKHVVLDVAPPLLEELGRLESWYLTEADRDN